MRIVQSFWTLPAKSTDALAGGWRSKRYLFLSWALSVLQLQKQYDELVLHTDDRGKHWLIDLLGLPYSSVHTSLNTLSKAYIPVWSYCKLHVYALQDEPFLHIDGDVVLRQPFEPTVNTAPLVAQQLEAGKLYYQDVVRKVNQHCHYLPPAYIRYQSEHPVVDAYNMGTFGGQDIDFIRAYAREAKQFINENLRHLPLLDATPFTTLAEQHIFHCMAREQQIPVYLLRHGESFNSPQSVRWAPYIHPIWRYKSSPVVCQVLEQMLKVMHPEYYYKIDYLLKHQKL